MKSHRRGSSSQLDSESLGGVLEEKVTNGSTHSSPIKSIPTSPGGSRGNKLQRLFLRGKSSSSNIQGMLASSSAANKPSMSMSMSSSPPLMIVGTRTHEWGTDGRTNRISFNSERSSGSCSSPEGLKLLEEEPCELGGDAGVDAGVDAGDEGVGDDTIELPLNTVLEIPEMLSPTRNKGKNSKKNRHRMAQIVSKDENDNDADVDHQPKTLAPAFDLNVGSLKIDDIDASDQSSQFSFDTGEAARNNSVRYYKDPKEVTEKLVVRQEGFYVNDFMEDDDFDDDLNYFDEDDMYNDDEELFNKKYFSDDEEEFQRPALKSTRSVKYHQVPVGIEQEFKTNRYSWMSDDETPKGNYNDSYDSLLDEINGVPDDYDYEKPVRPIGTRSKSLNSAIKRSNMVTVEEPQNTKFEIGQRTVTLFRRSRSTGAVPTNEHQQHQQQHQQQQYQQHQQQFAYLTPNNSFTIPTPGFMHSNDVELSPISEASYVEE